MPRRANKRRRSAEVWSSFPAWNVSTHFSTKRRKIAPRLFQIIPQKPPPPKIQSLSTHPRADVKVGWSLEVHKTFLELRCKEKVLQHNWRRWSQQKNGSIEFVTSGLINVSGSPELEFNQIDLRRRYLHPQPTVQLVKCTQCEVGARQRF